MSRSRVNVDYLGLLFRWLHILAAITAVGGAVFARFALLPAAATLGAEPRAALLEAVRMRWSKIVAVAIAFLLISGLFNIVRMERLYVLGKTYHMLFGIKFILAILIFGLASMLAGRGRAAHKLRENARFWLSVNLLMAVLLVCISGVLKDLPHTPKPAAANAATE
ncbi:MAG TPA: hypothetical protein VIK18_01700 [Pirellulales bacterium]